MKVSQSLNVFVALVATTLFTNCKAQMPDSTLPTRTINVTGSAEKEVEPDIIIFNITVKEYWKEEFEPGKRYEDYKTRIPMSDIEPQILAQLKKAGVKDDQIKVSAIGNFYRQAGKDFLVSKTLVLTLSEFSVVNAITRTIDSKGVSNMHIAQLKHTKMEELKKEVKILALKAAEEKADYMLKAIGEKRGPVLMINESEYGYNPPVQVQYKTMMADRNGGESASATELKKIKISYKVNATYAIAG